MKLNSSFFYTLREDVKDEDSASGNLLVRAGFIRKTSSGVYAYMPMGLRVLNKIRQIIKEEMEATGAQELLMPALLSEDVYVASGRKSLIGSSMFQLKDRFGRPFVLGPTHEELFTMIAKLKIQSYKDMPFNIYQFQDKFRDEPRPRFGLIRVREFIMKDAYSFDIDHDGLDVSYKKMFDAYHASFQRMGIQYRVVRADTGIMGGLLSEEFQAVTAIGEDTLVLCDQANYASNLEVAEVVARLPKSERSLPLEKVYTPEARTIDEVVDFLQQPISAFVKTLIYQVDDELVAVCVSGKRTVNEVKLQKLLHAKAEITLASPEQVLAVTKAHVGFAGPIGLDIKVIFDQECQDLGDFIIGANQDNYHYIHASFADFNVDRFADVVNIIEGDSCAADPRYSVTFAHGIEIGNTFKLGDKYSKLMELNYADENNQLKPVVMGSYGIGLGRCLAALVEQNHDDKGIIWPKQLAPYQVAIVIIAMKDETQVNLAQLLYEQLEAAGFDVILDDRNQRPGVKFNDMELIGIPLRITVGKKAAENIVELKSRDHVVDEEIELKEIVDRIKTLME